MFDTDGSAVLEALVNDKTALMAGGIDDLATQLCSLSEQRFDQERFSSLCVGNFLGELELIKTNME